MIETALVAEWDADAELLLDELTAAEEARRIVPLPEVLSASQLVRLRTDADGLARDLARPLPRPPAPQARRGTEFHAWVESLFDARPLLDPADLPGAGDAGVEDEPDLAALKEAFLATPYAARPPVAVEAPFELVLAGRVVRGRIDAVYADGGGFEVVDWKTGRSSADPTQLAIYRLAWAELAGVPVERVRGAFLYVRTGEVVRPSPLADRAELERLLGSEPGDAGDELPASSPREGGGHTEVTEALTRHGADQTPR
jgi:DNA helicase-2/ATP-dependent DNA helicase PcrA